jgi:6-phosphogluconolactonase
LSNVVFVGTYTRWGQAMGICAFHREPETGTLTQSHFVEALDPTWLCFDPRQQYLFAVSEGLGLEGGAVLSYRIEDASGTLTELSRQPTLGGEPCHMACDPTGRFLVVANHEHGSVVVLPIDAEGRLGPTSHFRQHEGSGPGPTQTGPHAHCVNFDLLGRRILMADKGIDKVMVYQLDTATGQLVPNDPPYGSTHPGAAPRHVAFHPNGRYVYVNGEADMTITAFSYDDETGALNALQVLSTLPEGANRERCSTAEIEVEPGGKFVYVSNRGHDSIAIFAIDEATGRLTTVGNVPSGGRTPRNFKIDPSGRFLYAANQDSDTIVQFVIDRQTGQLTPTGQVTAVGGPACILFS